MLFKVVNGNIYPVVSDLEFFNFQLNILSRGRELFRRYAQFLLCCNVKGCVVHKFLSNNV
jgi:hypothetical protein